MGTARRRLLIDQVDSLVARGPTPKRLTSVGADTTRDAAMGQHDERANLLRICRSVMPGVAGVVLATLAGHVVAHERERVPDPHALALEATHVRASDHGALVSTSALVPRDDGLYLVVFVPPPLAEERGAPASPALTA